MEGRGRPHSRRGREDGTVARAALPERGGRRRNAAAHHGGLAEHDGGAGDRGHPLRSARPEQVARCPSPNILYLGGAEIRIAGNPELTWAMNTVVPAIVAERFRGARIVAFSTGNVYPFRRCRAAARWNRTRRRRSASTRNRAWDASASSSTIRAATGRRALFRLNYAVDLRYGVVVDIARKVHAGAPVEVGVPAFNVIWQRDANSYALRSLEHCATPPRILNVTGPEICGPRGGANWFAARFGRECRFEGSEGATALLSDATACFHVLGAPEVTAEQLMEMVAVWIEAGGASLDKPTHFEVADGGFDAMDVAVRQSAAGRGDSRRTLWP